MPTITLNEEVYNKIYNVKKEGGTVQAIREVRSVTGLGLKEAKLWVVDNDMELGKEVAGYVWTVKYDNIPELMEQMMNLAAEMCRVYTKIDRKLAKELKDEDAGT